MTCKVIHDVFFCVLQNRLGWKFCLHESLCVGRPSDADDSRCSVLTLGKMTMVIGFVAVKTVVLDDVDRGDAVEWRYRCLSLVVSWMI